MTKVKIDITMFLDGWFPTRPDVEVPLGEDGERLHEWIFRAGGLEREPRRVRWVDRPGTTSWSRRTSARRAHTSWAGKCRRWCGPMGRRALAGVVGRRPSCPPAGIGAHHAPRPRAAHALQRDSPTFVTDGIESALEQAREAAGDRDVKVAGGAAWIGGCLKAGLVDELQFTWRRCSWAAAQILRRAG